MGILDDAIRQHLDLKRRLGAAEEELARLEDEAFGLPSRPGDPDFPETGSEPAQPLEGSAVGSPQAEAPAAERGAEAPATAEEPVAQAPAPVAEEPPPAPEPTAEATEPTPPPVSGVDTVEHDISAEPDGDDLDLDLELDLDDGEEPEAAPEPSASEPGDGAVTEKGTEEQSALEDTGERPTEPPIESLDTVEHQFEGEVEDTGEAEVVEGELEEPSAELGEAKGNGGEDEDVLEETPEFLRDQPEDDELWFEQGEPKDFDF